ncbi:MAG: hypothetical protein OEY22_01675 [Candidatus Bathyarchaeota archaeon]|nr:hypothetical protein [Candidatus Bathyarchaeota archaeon]
MVSKHYRIPEKVDKDIERDLKEQGLPSENEYVIKALEHYLKCKQTEVIQSMKLIVFRYPAPCLDCKREIKTGEWGYWGRGIGAICIDCSVKRYGTKAQAKLVIMVKTLQWQKQALTTEIDELAERYRKLNFYEILERMHLGSEDLQKLVSEYLKTNFQKPEQETKILEELALLIEKMSSTLNDAHKFMKLPLSIRKKKRKQEVTN